MRAWNLRIVLGNNITMSALVRTHSSIPSRHQHVRALGRLPFRSSRLEEPRGSRRSAGKNVLPLKGYGHCSKASNHEPRICLKLRKSIFPI